MRKILRRTLSIFLLAATVFVAAGCGGNKPADITTAKPADTTAAPQNAVVRIAQLALSENEQKSLSGATTVFADEKLKTLYEIKNCDSVSQMLLELNSDRTDAVVLPSSVCKYISDRNPGLVVVETRMPQSNLEMAMLKDKSELRDRINEAIDAFRADDSLDALLKEWVSEFPADKEPSLKELPKIDGATETLKIGVTGDMAPLDYIDAAGVPAGFNVALLSKIAEKLNVNIELVQLEAGSRTAALVSKKVDVVFWMRSFGDASADDDTIITTNSYFSNKISVVFKEAKTDTVKPMLEALRDAISTLFV